MDGFRAESICSLGMPIRNGSNVSFTKVTDAAKQTGVRKVHHAPKLFEAVFHRSSTERNAEGALQIECRAGSLAIEVLDGLSFVEHDHVERSFF